MQETWVQSLGWEDPLEEGMATHSSILAWRIPWTEEQGGLQSMGLQRFRQYWSHWEQYSIWPACGQPFPLKLGSIPYHQHKNVDTVFNTLSIALFFSSTWIIPTSRETWCDYVPIQGKTSVLVLYISSLSLIFFIVLFIQIPLIFIYSSTSIVLPPTFS